MKSTSRWTGFAAVVSVAVSVAGVMVPREAQAQVRVNGLAGVERVGGPGVPGMTGTLRLEGLVSLVPWIEAGAYGEALSALNGSATGTALGGIVALRPHIPGSSIDPMAFASVGYLKYPGNNGLVAGGWEAQLGAGLVFHVNAWVDIDARVALVEMISRDETQMDARGFAASAGISLHP